MVLFSIYDLQKVGQYDELNGLMTYMMVKMVNLSRTVFLCSTNEAYTDGRMAARTHARMHGQTN